MVEAIVGVEGTGKTPVMLEEIRKEAEQEANNIVFIEYGRRLDRLVSHRVRLIDITEYPVASYATLLAFISGLNAKDYDISHIYIDNIGKIVGSNDDEALTLFMQDLEKLARQVEVLITLAISREFSTLPGAVQKYARVSLP